MTKQHTEKLFSLIRLNHQCPTDVEPRLFLTTLHNHNAMKKTISFVMLLTSAIIMMQSCTIAKISGKGAVPVLLNQPSEQMQIVEHIKIKKNSNFDFSSSFDVSTILADEIAAKNPDAVINTTITIKTGVDNYFLNLITLGLAQSRKIVIEADMMKSK